MGRGEGHCIDGAAEADCEQRTATPEVLAADKIIDKEHTGTNETRGGGGRRVWREALKVFFGGMREELLRNNGNAHAGTRAKPMVKLIYFCRSLHRSGN